MVKALLVGVSDYTRICYPNLSYCKQDIYEIKNALVSGLGVKRKDITMLGTKNTVLLKEFIAEFEKLSVIEEKDTFFFYFSGHGEISDGYLNLLFSNDNKTKLRDIILAIEKLQFKNNIIVLDCCHAGKFTISKFEDLCIFDTFEQFVGRGCAIFASCGAHEESGKNSERNFSIYTGFLCDALRFRSNLKKGKKSLEDIHKTVDVLAKNWNHNNPDNAQQNIFRENIKGTIYFEITSYIPYLPKEIYEDASDYTIYEVKPLHHASAKRYAIKVILREKSDIFSIIDIANEIKDKALDYEVYQSKQSELYHIKQQANIIWCYFGFDESDMLKSQFAYITTWVDDSQDKKHWYTIRKDSFVENNIHIKTISCYELLKEQTQATETKEDYIKNTREVIYKIIEKGRLYINHFREYVNQTISEEQLFDMVESLTSEINNLYLEHSNLSYPPDEIYEWSQLNALLACSLHDFSLFYNNQYKDKWTKENRLWLTNSSITRYESDLQALKEYEIKNLELLGIDSTHQI